MALQLRNPVDAAYYQSAQQYCRNYTSSAAVSYSGSSHYLSRLPGPESMLKPALSLFSHAQQPFHHLDSLHQLGPPPMVPTQPLGHPPPAMGPPNGVAAQTLVPPPHALRPPPIAAVHSLGPPPLGLASLERSPARPSGPAALNHALVPPPVPAGANRFPPSPLSSSPLIPCPEVSQLPVRPGPALISSPASGLIAGPLPGQAAPASEQPQEEGSPLGREEQQEDALALEELCKPLYCKLCNVTVNSAQQAQAHYQGKNHSKKLRNFLAGSQQPPAVRIPEVLEVAGQTNFISGSGDCDSARQALYKGPTRVILATENDYCKLCDASFSSPLVAQAHYQGKNHAKKLRLAETQHNNNHVDCSGDVSPRRNRKEGNEYRLVKTRRSPQLPTSMQGPYFNPRPRQRIPRDLAMCVTPSGQFYCSMCNCGAEQEADFRQHLESKQHKAKVSELRYRNEMENLGYN
ncbi:zinc finger matrin-type protein 3 isoform X2 [Festucalex cinctus]